MLWTTLLFIYDPDDAMQYKLNQNDRLNTKILHTIKNVMRTHNAFANPLNMITDIDVIEIKLVSGKMKKIISFTERNLSGNRQLYSLWYGSPSGVAYGENVIQMLDNNKSVHLIHH